MSDDVLSVIKSCVMGDDEAWKSFADEYSRITMNILNGKFRDMAGTEKEDVTQNVFVKLAGGGLRNFKGKSKYEFLAYFKTIVINEGLTHIRKRDPAFIIPEPGEGEYPPDVPTYDPGPDKQTEMKEMSCFVGNLLKVYSLNDQLIFRMKVEQYKDREIAEMLKIPSGTVASTYSRMKEKIKPEFEAKYPWKKNDHS